MIRGVASATKQEMPAEVYLVGDMNAWVAHRGGLMGLGAHGIMGLGLPLLQTLSVSELRAVLAHEFGHYHGGDTKLGRFVYVTRAAIGRTLENLGRHGSILQLPFIWYGNLFLRVSHAVSRCQELAADQLAARVVGARPLAEGLKKIHVAAPVFGYYWSNEVTPVLHAGFVPPLADGFQRFVTGEIGQKAMAAAREHSLKEDAGDVFDTHPPLGERLKALEGARPGAVTGEDPLSITLLGEAQALERAVVAPVMPPTDGKPLAPIQWSEVGERVYQPLWRKETQAAAAHARPLPVDSLGRQASTLSETLGGKLLPEAGRRDAAASRELGARRRAGRRALAGRLGHRCATGRGRHAARAGGEHRPVRCGAGAREGGDERGGLGRGVRAVGDGGSGDASARGPARGTWSPAPRDRWWLHAKWWERWPRRLPRRRRSRPPQTPRPPRRHGHGGAGAARSPWSCPRRAAASGRAARSAGRCSGCRCSGIGPQPSAYSTRRQRALTSCISSID